MMGLLITEKEMKELEYMIRRELEEIIYDQHVGRAGSFVQKSMEERYKLLYQLFIRVAPQSECLQYVWRPQKGENNL